MDIPKSLPVYLDHYIVEGVVWITLWSGEEGHLNMTPTVTSELTRDKALEAVNDGGYGCESIDEAEVAICAIYKSDVQNSYGSISVFVDEFVFTSDELVNAKRGV